jgi:Ca-activated chloride channel family protein
MGMIAARRRAVATLLVFWALLCATALGQEPAQPEPAPPEGAPAVLLLMDSSLSMGKPAGSGQSRIEAARGAVRELVDAVPEDARLGLRLYLWVAGQRVHAGGGVS